MSFSDPSSSSSQPGSQSHPVSSQQDVDSASFLRNAQFSTPGSSPGSYATPTDAVTASDVLGAAALDPTRLHPLAGLGNVDYLLLDEDQPNELEGARTALPSRGWGDDLCYGTGTTYLSGLSIGGLMGLREGWRRQLGVSNARLRINSILNSVTRRGTFIGNSAGLLALFYNVINSSMDAARGKHDALNSITAGTVSGALFRCTSGVRPMIVSSLLVGSAAGIWSYGKRWV